MKQQCYMLSIFLLLLTIGCCYGAYVVEVTLHSYSNPTGRCDECQDGPEPGCCDEFFVRPAGQACPMSSACDTIIQHCVREDTGLMCDSFTYYSGDTNSLDIDNSVHSLDNPVIVRGEEPWDGIQVAFALFDCADVNNRCGSNNQIDIVFININISPGTSSPERAYTGNAGIAQFTVSYTVRCDEGFSGEECEICHGFHCVYVLAGTIVGGVLGGLGFLLCCVCVVLVGCYKWICSSETVLITQNNAARVDKTKVTNYELK